MAHRNADAGSRRRWIELIGVRCPSRQGVRAGAGEVLRLSFARRASTRQPSGDALGKRLLRELVIVQELLYLLVIMWRVNSE